MILLYPEARTLSSRQNTTSPPPAAPPPSNTPEIDGSSGGYIALVVVLAAIVIICCIGVFFLLRSHKNDPYERNARRILSGKREDSLYQMPLGPPGIRQKFKNLFKFGRKRDGWVRASSGDDTWDASDRLVYDPPEEHNVGGSHWVSGTTLYDAPSREREHEAHRVQRSETSDSIELSVPSVAQVSFNPDVSYAPSISREASHAEVYTDPFSTSPTSVHSSEAQRSVDVSRASEDEEDRRFSVRSGESAAHEPSIRSMRKFESGTKFKEGLEF
ncbi:hypothetical protein EIP86_010939 [Pleurotus ostreatoroseus]|nr:hypothetical protein EIP86_010939 [Pleurotus ostreatoroseus]